MIIRVSIAGAVALAALLLASCAPNQGPRAPGDRFYRNLPDRAQPSEVVAAELAFARMAQEEGQWTAFRKFATDDALIFGRNGAIEAKPWLKAQEDPPQAVQWEPHQVWSSCDGSLAVTTGGFVDPDGTVGRFHTVWQRQRGGEYKYVFDFGFPTETPPPEPEMIATQVAHCGPPPMFVAEQGMDIRSSRDGTLTWGFLLTGDGERRFVVWLAEERSATRVLDVTVPASPEG